MPDDAAILKEIKENWLYASSYWHDIYTEGEKDVRYEIEGPWDQAELDARKGQVTLSLDEFSQYLNQICNEFRQNKRAVKVNPRGDGANDETARFRAGIIREIEYQSRAQQAYVTAGECMVRRSFGFFKLLTEFEPGSFRRCLKVGRVPNPHVIFLDPDAKEQDWSDAGWGFEIDKYRERDFKKKFGNKATITDFDGLSDDQRKGWITSGDNGKNIQVASYWRLDTKPQPLYLLENGREVSAADGLQVVKIGAEVVAIDGQQFKVQKAAVLDGVPYRVIDEREDNEKTVTQYITNGIEILGQPIPSDFKEIPIIPMFGREEWVPDGGVSKRKFLSAVRLARDAYKGYCYVRSAAVARAARDVKSPYEGWEGQFATQTDFSKVNQVQQGFVEFKPAIDPQTGNAVWDKPSQNLAEPQLTQHEVLAEALRRAIQAAMGGSPLPTSAQRQNQKSGVALENIENSNDQGNFHFMDNYNIALERAGRMMDDALDVVYDTPREVGLRDEAGEYSTMRINERDPETDQPVGFHTGKGKHGVTISTGPSSADQRDAADKTVDQLIARPEILGPAAPRILALLIKLKNLGPIGDQISELLSPTEGGVSPEIAAQIGQAQQTIQEMAAEIERLKAGDEIKRYTVDETEKTKRVLGLMKIDQQDAEVLLEKMLGVLETHTQRFDEMQKMIGDQKHQTNMAEMQHGQSLEQQERAAALAPKPEGVK
jgi:hypothetical protein